MPLNFLCSSRFSAKIVPFGRTTLHYFICYTYTMKYLLIRHGKTDANNLTRAAFGKAGAPLNEQGQAQAKQLKTNLELRGVSSATPVAVSGLTRTHQTASIAGFTSIHANPLLNEVAITDPEQVQALIAEQKLPQHALDAAKAIIKNPPKQTIWVTHGPVIAALQQLLGRNSGESFMPEYCEIREIEIQ